MPDNSPATNVPEPNRNALCIRVVFPNKEFQPILDAVREAYTQRVQKVFEDKYELWESGEEQSRPRKEDHESAKRTQYQFSPEFETEETFGGTTDWELFFVRDTRSAKLYVPEGPNAVEDARSHPVVQTLLEHLNRVDQAQGWTYSSGAIEEYKEGPGGRGQASYYGKGDELFDYLAILPDRILRERKNRATTWR